MKEKNNPSWYWNLGLHDAKIMNILNNDLSYDYKEKNQKRNFIRLTIDSSKALCDNTVKEIIFYNAKIIEDCIEFSDLWWDVDELKQIDKKWIVDITLSNYKYSKHLIIRFTEAEILRSKI